MKRLTAVLLIVCMLALTTSAVSCGNKEAANTPTGSAGAATAAPDLMAGTTEEPKILPQLPDNTFDNYDFTILVSGNSELNVLRNDFHAEKENGDVINDARYKRNIAVEEKYKVKIVDQEIAAGADNGFNAVKKMVLAGDSTYDATMVAGYASCKLASQGYILDLNAIPYIDLRQPWWDQKANEDLTIAGKMFYTTGDISTVCNDATYCILFNKQLAADYDLGNFYQLVNEGKWTIDKFVELSSKVHKDLNGDGAYDTNDLFGALIWDDSMMGIVNAAGEKCCSISGDGKLQLTLFSDKIVSMFNKYTEYVYDKSMALTYQRKNWDGIAANNMFANNQALFYVQLLSLVTQMRSMDTDFGVLPYFKYSEDQKDYYSTVGSWHSMFLCVPSVQKDVERTGIILEALAADSKYTVKPAYYEIALKGKYARDEESRSMLDIILSTRTYDVGWFYAIGGYNEEIMNLLRNFKSDFTSMYDKRSTKAQSEIDKLNETFAEILG